MIHILARGTRIELVTDSVYFAQGSRGTVLQYNAKGEIYQIKFDDCDIDGDYIVWINEERVVPLISHRGIKISLGIT